jgi:hypothetical protein
MTKTENPEDLLPLTPAMFHILLALSDRERHGYDIMREVDERTEGKMRLGPGTLYGSIKRMLQSGLIEELDQRPDPELDDEDDATGSPTGYRCRLRRSASHVWSRRYETKSY